MIPKTLIQRFKEMIKGTFTTNQQKDTGGFDYAVQVETGFLGTTAAVYYPYGYYANTPVGSHGILFNLNAQQENQFILPYDPKTRFIGLQPYEVMMGNQQQKIYIRFLNNGNVEILANSTALVTCKDSVINCSNNSSVTCVDSSITCSGNSTVDCVDSTITTSGNSLIDATGTANVNCSTSTIDGTLVTMTGNLQVDGNITTMGNVTAVGDVSGADVSDGSGSLSNNRTKYNMHTHSDPQGGSTGTPTPTQP